MLIPLGIAEFVHFEVIEDVGQVDTIQPMFRRRAS